ncbi:hypothetical protein CsSME_00019715 [Camellia sinensis var. sinensis]
MIVCEILDACKHVYTASHPRDENFVDWPLGEGVRFILYYLFKCDGVPCITYLTVIVFVWWFLLLEPSPVYFIDCQLLKRLRICLTHRGKKFLPLHLYECTF